MKGVNLQRLEAELSARDLGIAVITSPANLAYVSGVSLTDEDSLKWSAGIRNAVVLTRTGEPTLIVADSSEHQAKRDSWIKDIRTYAWLPDHTLAAAIISVIKDRGPANNRIGVEMPYFPVQIYQFLVEALPRATFVDCSEAFAYARSIKTPEEISVMRTAIAATERALAAALTAARAGNTERDIARNFIDNVYKFGADRIEHVWMYGGDRTTDKFRPPGEKRLRSGDLLRVDVGAIFKGYNSDVARMAIVGKPSEAQKRIYRGLWEAQQRMIECVRPGVAAGKLIQAFGEECRRHGLPFSDRGLLAHGLGLVVHDYPVVQEATDSSIIEEGMILAIEPYVVVSNEKYAVEDDILVTKNGADILSANLQSQEMWPIAD